MEGTNCRYLHVLLLHHLHVHLLYGQRDTDPVLDGLAQANLVIRSKRGEDLFQQELRLLPTGEGVAHLHLDLLTGSGGAVDVALALLHAHHLANQRSALSLQVHLWVKRGGSAHLSFRNGEERLEELHLGVVVVQRREERHALLHQRSDHLQQR